MGSLAQAFPISVDAGVYRLAVPVQRGHILYKSKPKRVQREILKRTNSEGGTSKK